FKGAVTDFSAAIALNPKSASAYYGRGSSRVALNQKAAACADLEKAKQLGSRQAVNLISQNCQ
ncbi:MAG: hypothetical protein ACO1NZ_17085, partial [Adhaeribacter sp.]